MIRVLVVDDHPTIHNGLKNTFTRDKGFNVEYVCASVEQARAHLQATAGAGIDLAFVDISLEGNEDGISLVRYIRKHHRRIYVAVFTMYPPEQKGVEALEAGADGYLDKAMTPREIRRKAGEICSGKKCFPDHVIEVHKENSGPVLSDREREFMVALARNPNTGDLCSALGISPSTVYTHIRRIGSKVGVSGKPALTSYAAVEFGGLPRAETVLWQSKTIVIPDEVVIVGHAIA